MGKKGKVEEDVKRNKVREITEQLHKGIQELFESDKFKEYLRTMSKFTNYSFNNAMLIAMQRPDASAVAGYRSWETKFNRHVKKGSQGIAILEPCPYKKTVQEVVTDGNGKTIKDADGNDVTKAVEKIIQGFKVGYIFAYEDTEGSPLPAIVNILEQSVDNYEMITEVLETVSPVPIYYEEINSNANGYFSLADRSIHVDSRLPELQSIKTTIHETAHSLLHDKVIGEDQEANRNEREVCAESVAYTVCAYLGMDAGEYSFGYIAGWAAGKELKELQQKMELIRRTANKIITDIENELLKRKMNESESLAFKNSTGYFYIERTNLGYRYEMYDPNFVSLSQGKIMDASIPMQDALEKSMAAIGSNETAWNPFDTETLKQKILKQENVKTQDIGAENQNPKKTISQKR